MTRSKSTKLIPVNVKEKMQQEGLFHKAFQLEAKLLDYMNREQQQRYEEIAQQRKQLMKEAEQKYR